LNDQRSGEALMRLLEDHCRASNGRVNYGKTKILKIGNGPMVKLGNAEVIQPPGQVAYLAQERYLGVPIGQQVDYTPTWLELERSVAQTITVLKGVRNDLRTRVLLSKSLMYSKVHFLARFSPVPPLILKRIEKAVGDYIWNRKTAVLNKTAMTLPVVEGGINAMDLSLQIQTAKVCLISRMEACPDLPWVKIAVKVIAGSRYRTLYPIRERITKPWRQHVSARKVALPPVLQSMMTAWDKSQHVFVERIPTTTLEALSINFWYRKKDGATAKTFSCESWRAISSGVHGKADLIGDIWDPLETSTSLCQNGECSSVEWEKRKAVVLSLAQNLDAEAKDLLSLTDSATLELFRGQREEFCPVGLKLGKDTIPLPNVKHRILYTCLVKAANRGQADKIRQRIAPLLDQIHAPNGEDSKVLESIWKGSRSKEFIPNASDFVWRMLHSRNYYGEKLKGGLEYRGMCYQCGVICTEKHLLIECTMADRLWRVRGELWRMMGGNRGGCATRAKTVSELKLMLCRPSVKDVYNRTRHRILTSLLVWVLWKLATQQWYDGKAMTVQEAVLLYKQLILDQIHVDRIECEAPMEAGKLKKLEAKFLAVWGFPRSKLTVGGCPKYLRAI